MIQPIMRKIFHSLRVLILKSCWLLRTLSTAFHIPVIITPCNVTLLMLRQSFSNFDTQNWYRLECVLFKPVRVMSTAMFTSYSSISYTYSEKSIHRSHYDTPTVGKTTVGKYCRKDWPEIFSQHGFKLETGKDITSRVRKLEEIFDL